MERNDIRESHKRTSRSGLRGACHRARIRATRWLHPGYGNVHQPGTPLLRNTKHAPPALRMRLQRSSAAGRVSAPMRTW
jgi:hypothetical protein